MSKTSVTTIAPPPRATAATAAKITALLCAAAMALSSCATIQSDVVYDALPGDSAMELASIESELARSRAVPGVADLPAIRKRLAEIAAAPRSDSSQAARALALAAEAALQSGDRGSAAKRLAEAKAANGGDEVAAVVASRLAPTLDERLAMLQKSIGAADEARRLSAELGSAMLAAGRIREALAAFDSALPYLDEAYGLLYSEDRDRAYALRDAEVAPLADSTAYLSRDPITLVGMAVVAQAETIALDRITGGLRWAPGVLYDRLAASLWYADPAAGQKTMATRKDAALFLWMMMTRGEARAATKYTTRYAARQSSPVPDIAYGSPYFDAVLGVVEESVMSLVDGKNFNPDGPASGLDFYGWLLAAAAWR